jgi:cytochrome c-type biogenesis protein CcmH/NrfG
LTQWGYDLLKSRSNVAAAKVFELNVALNPTSANAYDSLGDGYAAAGDTASAVRAYTRALTLDPNAKHTAEKLKRLSPHG